MTQQTESEENWEEGDADTCWDYAIWNLTVAKKGFGGQVFVSVCTGCVYACITLPLLPFKIYVANGPCITNSLTEHEWVGEERLVTLALPITRPMQCVRVHVCLHCVFNMHECMCVLMCRCEWEHFCVQEVWKHDMRAHTCKREGGHRVNSQTWVNVERAGNLMPRDWKWIQSVFDGRKKNKWEWWGRGGKTKC